MDILFIKIMGMAFPQTFVEMPHLCPACKKGDICMNHPPLFPQLVIFQTMCKIEITKFEWNKNSTSGLIRNYTNLFK